jgi:probable non-F420 flavinoid oxidoreductase
MPGIGWHASHEQIPPSRLLEDVRRAQDAGFAFAMSSDHLEPWSTRQGESGFAWAWLGAALATTDLPFRVVSAPGQRYHPAVLAQAAATLAEMFPGRLRVCLGSGEAMNEHVTGDPWPPKPVRNARLAECAQVMRGLLAGEQVTHRGLVTVDRARLWSLPAEPPLLLGAAVSPQTARWLGGWADGLATVHQPRERLARVVEAFREGGGEGKPMLLQVHLSWAGTDEEALRIAHDQWRTNVFAPPLCWDLDTVEHFDEAARHVRPEDLHDVVLISSDLARHAEWIREAAELGFDEVALHHVGKRQDGFIDAAGERLLPELS